jgi:hypothetical protein
MTLITRYQFANIGYVNSDHGMRNPLPNHGHSLSAVCHRALKPRGAMPRKSMQAAVAHAHLNGTT